MRNNYLKLKKKLTDSYFTYFLLKISKNLSRGINITDGIRGSILLYKDLSAKK